jgi:hypothetical protein
VFDLSLETLTPKISGASMRTQNEWFEANLIVNRSISWKITTKSKNGQMWLTGCIKYIPPANGGATEHSLNQVKQSWNLP